ncbi:MAG: CHAT domain-containing protein [Desulfococcaceae bacterium]
MMISEKIQIRVFVHTVSFALFLFFLSTTAFTAENPEKMIDRAKDFYRNGETSQAAALWENALAKLDPETSPDLCLDTAVQLAGIYQMSGFHQRAMTVLNKYLPIAEKNRDHDRKAIFFSALSDLHLSLGDIANAAVYAEKAVAEAREGKDRSVLANALLNTGNVLAADGDFEAAAAAFGECLALMDQNADEKNDKNMTDSADPRMQEIKAKVLINAARVTLLSEKFQDSANALEYAVSHVNNLPDSQEKAGDLIALGLLIRDMQAQLEEMDQDLNAAAHRVFTQAAEIAEKYKDSRTLSCAYGYTGELHEQQHQYEDALQLTRKAVFFARQGAYQDILYLWLWQSGRVSENMGNRDSAIRAYTEAVSVLTPIRSMLFSGYRSGRDAFSEKIKPVYLGLADLLLKQAENISDVKARQEKLRQARDTVETLKSAELENFFEDECVTALKSKTQTLDRSPAHTAVLYPIMLPDRLVILLTFPDGMDQVSVEAKAQILAEKAMLFRMRLQTRPNNRFLHESRELYDWLVRPAEHKLREQKVDTLVIAPDGALRQIPFATLHDGEGFLAEKYAIATIPAVSLTDPKPLGDRESMKIFLGGISEAVQDFSPLPGVTAELRDIKEIMSGQILLQDKNYTLDNLAKQFKNNEYDIVHLATHGVFGTSPEDSFVLTYDDKMTMNRLEELISYSRFRENPVQLLTLSACQTALGDERAALGLAGVAVKAGVRSAVATLWYVDDEATSLVIREFYRQLKTPGLSKAKALQNAQKKLISRLRFRHPAYWGPFLLIGNWM